MNQVKKNPFFDNPVVDCETYDAMAKGIADGDWIGKEVFFQAPLYGYFLGLVYKVFGHDYFRARLIQLLVGSLNCVLVYILGRALFSRAVGAIASLVASLYGVLFFFEAELLSPVLVVFLSLSLILLLLWSLKIPAGWRLGLCGLVAGLLIVAYPQLFFFLPAALFWILWSFRRKLKTRSLAAYAGLFCLGTALVVSTVTLRNYAVGRDFVLVSSNGGLNLYLGNNPDYDRTVGMRPGLEWEELNLEAKKLGLSKPSEKSAYFSSMAFRFMREDPADFLLLLVRKAQLYWKSDEMMRNQEIYPFRRYSSLLQSLLWKRPGLGIPFGLLAPFSLLGIGLSFARWREFLLPLLFIGAQFLATITFFVASRYRVPAIPFLILFAAFAARWLFDRIRERRLRQVALSVPVLVVLFLAVNSGLGRMPESWNADAYYTLGAKYAKRGELDRAMVEFSKALSADPDHCDTHLGLGRMYVELGSFDRGLAELRRALKGCPNSALIYLNIAIAHQKKGEYESALQAYERAVELYPDYRDGHLGLATVLEAVGRSDSALLEYAKVVEEDPGYYQAYFSMGNIYSRMGMTGEARDAYGKALKANPNLVRELVDRADLLLESGHYDEAIEDYLSVSRLDSVNVKALFNLGYLYAKQDMPERAIAAYERVLDLQPEMLVARYNLGDLYLKLGLGSKARGQFEKIKRENPEFPGIDKALDQIRD